MDPVPRPPRGKISSFKYSPLYTIPLTVPFRILLHYTQDVKCVSTYTIILLKNKGVQMHPNSLISYHTGSQDVNTFLFIFYRFYCLYKFSFVHLCKFPSWFLQNLWYYIVRKGDNQCTGNPLKLKLKIKQNKTIKDQSKIWEKPSQKIWKCIKTDWSKFWENPN